MAVPKASVDKYDGPVFRQYKVRFAGKIGSVKPVSEAGIKKKFADKHLRLRILGSDL